MTKRTKTPRATARTVATWDELLRAIDGRRATHDGLRGKIRVERYMALYPTKHPVVRVYHEPTDRRNPKYLAVKRKLGDDWSSDLTDNFDAVLAIARRLGVRVK